ncbi:unnamed protein product [Fusarium venenatum]|uniref:Uncharacterized protein n=1 Tax=Fusarium venenatum TaxID=56646 RepID=A0A2L2THZ0_9HYPO|nr:uncharacterized protein FVRRES_00539 [Fusarium venenatum]CEI64027.1 unnamed protein product [Fusarium venenatum]
MSFQFVLQFDIELADLATREQILHLTLKGVTSLADYRTSSTWRITSHEIRHPRMLRLEIDDLKKPQGILGEILQ